MPLDYDRSASPECTPIVFHDLEIVGAHGARVIYEE